MYNGIDVSAHQGKINWAVTKKQGVDFAMIRASCSMHTDARLAMNVNGCKENSIPYGFYHTLYADSVEGAKREADVLLTSIKGFSPSYPIAVDCEYWDEFNSDKTLRWTNRNLSKEAWIKMICAFCDKLKKAGYYAMIYASTAFLQGIDAVSLDRYDKWVADWRGKCGYTKPFGIWQSEVKPIAAQYGCSCERLDFDVSYKNYPYIIKNAGLNGFTNSPAPAPAPAPAPVPNPIKLKKETVIRIRKGAIDLNSRKPFLDFVYCIDRVVMNDVTGNRVVFGANLKDVTGAVDIRDVIRK